MENASRALLMAGGVLIAVIIIALMVSLFRTAGSGSRSVDNTMTAEQIAKFNANFTKYLGQDLTIHQVVTICDFAQNNGTYVVGVPSTFNTIAKRNQQMKTKIAQENAASSGGTSKKYYYQIKIDAYDTDANSSHYGYVKKISFTGGTSLRNENH